MATEERTSVVCPDGQIPWNSRSEPVILNRCCESSTSEWSGPLLYGFSADPVAPAKVMANFAKTNPQLVIKAGAMPNNVLDVAGVEKLATMPSRDELLAKLMATMNEPVAKFVRTLNEVPARFVRTLAAVRDAKEQAAA